MPVRKCIRVQWTIPNPWSPIWPWINSLGHKTKQRDRSVGKRLVGKGRGGGQEGDKGRCGDSD